MQSEIPEIPASAFKHAFDQAPIGIAFVSRDAQWLYVNDEICEIFGYTPDEIKRRTWRELTVDADIDADQMQVDRCLERNGLDGYSMEKRYRRKAPGETFWASLIVTALRDDDGELEMLCSYIVPCARPAAVAISWAWALKNWRPIGSAIASAIVFVAWAFGFLSDEKFETLKKLLF